MLAFPSVFSSRRENSRIIISATPEEGKPPLEGKVLMSMSAFASVFISGRVNASECQCFCPFRREILSDKYYSELFRMPTFASDLHSILLACQGIFPPLACWSNGPQFNLAINLVIVSPIG